MLKPHVRGKPLADKDTARSKAVIDINEPKFLTVEIPAPYAQGQSRVKTTTQAWHITGKDITGDGLVVGIPGFSVDVITPQAHDGFKIKGNRTLTTPIRANVVMMCGCPVEPDGMMQTDSR
ncbi:MAG: hypothetical protein KatS3mg078_1995 [Deltaproteobacteria bacterium]|nr:MAG: hypothetical protein KatS3mg078_1995 [Deltaproteobacteria bacterium]